MGRNSIFAIIILTFVWIILREDLSVISAATGAVLSAAAVIFCNKLLPLPGTSGVNPLRLAIYLLFLLKEIYKAGFWAIKVILTGSRIEVMEMKTTLPHLLSRTFLANSITLVPGSISLNMKDDTITVLWLLEEKMDAEQGKNSSKFIVGKLEKMLSKVQK